MELSNKCFDNVLYVLYVMLYL